MMRTALLALGFACAVVEPSFAASGGFADTAATYLAVFIIVVMPIGGIVLFWLVHVLPEKIAEKRHHPQKDAIHVLCLLSLVFGGLLWPLAWLWAYSKPVMYKMAYGTDVHPDALKEHQDVPALETTAGAAALSDRLARLEQRGVPAAELKALRADLDAIEAKYTVDEAR